MLKTNHTHRSGLHVTLEMAFRRRVVGPLGYVPAAGHGGEGKGAVSHPTILGGFRGTLRDENKPPQTLTYCSKCVKRGQLPSHNALEMTKSQQWRAD